MCVRRWFSAYHPSKVPGLEAQQESSEICDFDATVAEVDGEGNWDLLDLTSGLELYHIAPIRVDYDEIRNVFSTASLSLPKSVDDLCLTGRSAPALSDRPVVDTQVGALEETWRPVMSL